MRKDPFNIPNAEYDIFVNGLYGKVNTQQVAWSIDAAVVAIFLALLTAWNSKWAISKNKAKANSSDRKNTVLARKALSAFGRKFVKKWIFMNDNMTDADIKSCGLQPYDPTRTRIGKPTSKPEMTYEVETGGTHRLNAFYRQQPDERGVSVRRKPDGVARIKVAIMFLDDGAVNTATLDPDTFPRTVSGSRSPIELAFKPADAGKKVALAACYVTKRGLHGDWTVVQVVRVP